jgi:GNAT superfamily N-acetyltransferase
MSDVTYRWIDGPTATEEEWERIDKILEARGWMALNRATSRILVAEDPHGILSGVFTFQLIPHTEPMWVSPAYRGTDVAAQLADRMLEFLRENQARGWMIVADNPIAARMCEERGMRRVHAPVYMAGGA